MNRQASKTPVPTDRNGDAHKPTGPSLASRLATAIALTVAFYVLAAGLALAMIAAPVILYLTTGRIGNVWLDLFLVIAGVTILKAIMPRRLRFDAPGLSVTRDKHPRLVSEIEATAHKT